MTPFIAFLGMMQILVFGVLQVESENIGEDQKQHGSTPDKAKHGRSMRKGHTAATATVPGRNQTQATEKSPPPPSAPLTQTTRGVRPFSLSTRTGSIDHGAVERACLHSFNTGLIRALLDGNSSHRAPELFRFRFFHADPLI
ncbi:MAG: hypothetical protein U0M13_04900 [Desulfovibrio fairfieldensis]|nr:hypothetical protein [Desulfovibrio fairfieldensis]